MVDGTMGDRSTLQANYVVLEVAGFPHRSRMAKAVPWPWQHGPVGWAVALTVVAHSQDPKSHAEPVQGSWKAEGWQRWGWILTMCWGHPLSPLSGKRMLRGRCSWGLCRLSGSAAQGSCVGRQVGTGPWA